MLRRVVGPTEAAKFFGNSIDGWLRYHFQLPPSLPLPYLLAPSSCTKLRPTSGVSLLNAPRHLAPVSCPPSPPPHHPPPPAHVTSLLLLLLLTHCAVAGVVAGVESAAQIGCLVGCVVY